MDSGDIGLGVNEIGRAVEQSLSAGAKVLEVIITGWKPDWGVSWFRFWLKLFADTLYCSQMTS